MPKKSVTIDGVELTKEHIGRWVEYWPGGEFHKEIGRIRQWKGSLVYVVYHCNEEWDRFEEFSPCGTHCKSLHFCDPPFEFTKKQDND